MPIPSSDSLTFYPAYCFPLSPTYNTWARLTSADVHALKEREGYDSQNLYFHLNHPIKWIRLVGVIVAFDCYYNRWSMVLDDSCGATIELLCWRPTPPKPTNDTPTIRPESPSLEDGLLSQDAAYTGVTGTGRTINLKGYDVGAVVKVKGGLSIYRGEKQVMLERISILPSTNDEVTAWAETSAFRRDILSTSWVVGDQDLRRARRKAEGLERHERREEEKRRRKQKKLGEELMSEKKKEKASRRRKRTDDEGRDSAGTENGQGKAMREKKKEKASHRRRRKDNEGRDSAGTENCQGKARGRQREKDEDDERERWKDGQLMKEQEEGKDQKKTASDRVHRREVRIPNDQQDLLNREEFLLPDNTIVQGRELESKSRHHYPPPAGKYDALGL